MAARPVDRGDDVTIGLLQIDLAIPGSRSLKSKRRVVRSLKERMRNRFNCSVAETGLTEMHARARIAVCVVSGDSRHANEQLNAIVQFAFSHPGAEILDYGIEML